MSHGQEFQTAAQTPLGFMSQQPRQRWLAAVARVLGVINRGVVVASMVAIVVACLVLTTGVFLRYFFKMPTDWQDEVSVFLLVGSIFLCGAAVQAQRGHIGIEAIAGWLSPSANRLRIWLCDVLSLLFCGFFAWKSWTLCMEAWNEGMTTSSTWAPPLWIPYGLMSVGMTLLVMQLLVQVLMCPHCAQDNPA